MHRVLLLLVLNCWYGTSWINPGTPAGVPEAFDCAARTAALDFGKKLLPRHGNFKTLFDALQLQNCGKEPPLKLDEWQPPTLSTPTAGTTIFVSPHGSDSNPGTESQPVKTLSHAVSLTKGKPRPASIVLMGGTYYETEVSLTEEDSDLSIQNYKSQTAIVSGGKHLNIPASSWQPVKKHQGFLGPFANQNNVYDRAVVGKNITYCDYLGKHQTPQECMNTAQAQSTHYYSFTWHGPKVNPSEYRTTCFGVKVKTWQPVPEGDIYSGYFVNQNIYKTDLSSHNIQDITGLRINNQRAIRARYPNGNPELSGEWYITTNPGMGGGYYDQGWMKGDSHLWIPPHRIEATDIMVSPDEWPSVHWPKDIPGGRGTSWEGDGNAGNFSLGIGGNCANMHPPAGYWCANHPPRTPNGGLNHRAPQGFKYGDVLVNGPYKQGKGAVIHTWRNGGRWYTYQCLVEADDTNNKTFMFDQTKGCNQGGEGTDSGDQWWIENVLEELDDENEWFFDTQSKMLYYSFNSTMGPTGQETFVATSNKQLFKIQGSSQQKAVANISITGITMRDTAITYLDAHGLPSGGDWGLQRSGAITIENATDINIDSNLFTRLDGLGIYLTGYTRSVSIQNNDMEWIGGTAIASWGVTGYCLNEACTRHIPYPIGPDGRGGNQPRGTQIRGNLVREIGIWQKQSSFYFQAVTAQTIITGNVHFNGPRAGINFNDGFGGGDLLSHNLLANDVRESGDHGPFNSWDRVPYIHDIAGQATTHTVIRHITKNFVISSYSSQESFDNDDGSCYYNETENFEVYPTYGLKSDFNGHNNWQFDNIYAWVQSCEGAGNYDMFFNNWCITRHDSGYNSDCHLPPGMKVYTNRVATPNGTLTVCGKSFKQWQAEGHDKMTTLSKWPNPEDVVNAAKKMLGF